MAKPKENEQTNPAEKIARETMTGDLRDCLLDFLKHDKNPLPWNMQGEQQQQDAIDKVTKAVNHAVEKAVTIIAAGGRATIRATVDQVVIKDGLKATLTMSKADPLRHELSDAQGNVVLLVVCDKDAYEGERKAALPDPDQPKLIGDDYDEAA